MKNLLIPFLFFLILGNGFGQSQSRHLINEYINVDRISETIGAQTKNRSFEFFPQSIKQVSYSENIPSDTFRYALTYNNGNISRIDFSVYSLPGYIEYQYNDAGQRQLGTLYHTIGNNPVEKLRYVYGYDQTGFLNCLKIYSNNVLNDVDSVHFEYENGKVVSWTRFEYENSDNPLFSINSYIRDIKYEGDEIVSFDAGGMLYGNFPMVGYFKFRNLQRFEKQKFDFFLEASDHNRFHTINLGGHIFGPDDAASIVLPFHSAATVYRVDALTGEEHLEHKTELVENGPDYIVNIFNTSDPLIPLGIRSYEYNEDGKLTNIITSVNNEIERRFFYNDFGKLIRDESSFNGGAPSSFYDYIYEYNDENKLVYYTSKYESNGNKTQNDEYFFYYNGPLKKDDFVEINVEIFPNPVTDRLNIVASEKVTKIKIMDMNGQLKNSINNSNSIDLRQLVPGAYLAEITTIEGKTIRKFVKN